MKPENTIFLQAMETPTTSNDILITVDKNGSIDEALTMLSGGSQRYKQLGVSVTIKLLSGFIMKEQVIVKGMDLSFIEIIAEDKLTLINSDGLLTPLKTEYGEYLPVFAATHGGAIPRIATHFKLVSTGHVLTNSVGILLDTGSHGFVSPGAGIQGADQAAMVLNFSTLSAVGSTHTQTIGQCVLFADNGSKVNINKADLSGAKGTCVIGSSLSVITAVGANLSNAEGLGILMASGATINASYADVSYAGRAAVKVTDGASAILNHTDCESAKETTLAASTGGKIIGTGTIVTNPGEFAAFAGSRGSILLTDPLMSTTKHDIVSVRGGGSVQLGSADGTFTVGEKGQFKTIHSAIKYITHLGKGYFDDEVKVVINLLAGFVMEEQLIFDGENLSWITITGTDDETNISRDSMVNRIKLDCGSVVYPAFTCRGGAVGPMVDQGMILDTSGDGGITTVLIIGEGTFNATKEWPITDRIKKIIK